MRRVGFLLAWTSAAQEFCEAVHMRGLPDIQMCADEDNPPSYTVEYLPAMGEGVAFNSDVTAKFYGTKSVSKRIFLSTTSGGPKTLQTVSMADLGAPQAVEVEILGDYELPWRCFRIILRLGYRWWQFNCYDELNSQLKKKKTQTFRLSGSLPYELHVQTLEGDKAGTKSAVDLVLVGEERETEPALVRNGFRQGSTTRVVLNAADVGVLTAIRLTNHGHEDSWYCGSVIVRSADGTTSVFSVNKWIGQPYEAVVTIPLESKSSEAPPVDAECHTRAQDLTTYVGTQPRSVLVRCPYNCANDKYSRVLGSSLHPSPASVCACAVYDGVLSNSGGVVEMTVGPGVNKYSLDANNPSGMRALPYEPTPEQHSFSFVLAKVESPDDIDSNVRVVDPWGRLANVGRLEIRREGDEWGTICKEGVSRKTNAEVAVVACHDLGYLTGMVEEECGNVGGQRVCGTTGYRSLAGGVLCTGAEKSLADCVYEDPSRICSDHSFDLAVTCTNNPPDREPPEGALRVLNAQGEPDRHGRGRLEVWRGGAWASVCDDGWNGTNAAVACRSMGYIGLKDQGLVGVSCKDFEGINICGNATQKIGMTDVACVGNEPSMKACTKTISEDIFCTHSEDVLIECEGPGDPTGLGTLKKEDDPAVHPRPYYPHVVLECKDRAMTRSELKSSTGGVFSVECPEGCLSEDEPVHGTFAYTDDSGVCKAAIHAGVIGAAGGRFTLSLGQGLDSFMASTRNGVTSEASQLYPRSFSLHPSMAEFRKRLANDVKSVEGRVLGNKGLLRSDLVPPQPETVSFLQISEDPSPKPEEKASAPPEPLLVWCSADLASFNSKERVVDLSDGPSGEALKALEDFSILLTAKLDMESPPNWRTLLSHSDCDGFALEIGEQNTLIFEKLCSDELYDTGFTLPPGEWSHLGLTYSAESSRLTAFANGNELGSKTLMNHFGLNGHLKLGSKREPPFSKLDMVRIYNTELPAYLMTIKAERSEVCPKDGSALVSKKQYSVDGRPCLTPCAASRSEAKSQAKKPKSTKAAALAPVAPPFTVQCHTTLENDPRFDGTDGDVFVVICPPGCGSCCGHTVDEVQGLFTGNSSVCKSALRRNLITDELGGNVQVTTHRLQLSLRGFDLEEPHSAVDLECHERPDFLMRMQEKDRLLISCPNACSADDAAVLHGSGQFAASSPPCLAAAKIGLGSEGLLLRMTRGPPYGRGYEILGPSLQLTEDVVRFQQTDAKCLPFTWRSLFTDSMVHPLSFFADVDFRDRPSDDPSWRQSGRKLLLPFRPGLPDRLPHALLLKGQAGCPVRSAELTFSVKSEGTSGGLVFGVSKDAKDFAYAEILSEAGQVGSLDLMHRKDSKTYRLGETVKVQLPFEKPTKLAVAVKPGEKYWDLDVLLDERPVYRLQVPATALESMGRGRVGFGGSSTSSGFYVEDFNVTYA